MANQKGTDRRFYYATAGKVGLVLMAVFLVFYMITILSGSSDFFDDSAQRNALLAFEEDIERAEKVCGELNINLDDVDCAICDNLFDKLNDDFYVVTGHYHFYTFGK